MLPPHHSSIPAHSTSPEDAPRATVYRSHAVAVAGHLPPPADVTLCGRVETLRDHGGVRFFHLKDASGRLQCVADPARLAPDAWKVAEATRVGDVVRFSGKVVQRPPGTERTRLDAATVELDITDAEILNPTQPLPFRPEDRNHVGEDLRLKYRHLDLRSDTLGGTLRLRSRFVAALRTALLAEDFVEVETPLLAKSTPEGARDFLVPSRLHPGRFYALPQSPQLFKQLLMMGDMERYFQVARCLRDEDLRANRQPEFTQLDVEMAYAGAEDIMGLMERALAKSFTAVGAQFPAPIPRMSYDTALRRYGTDAPDLRYGLPLVDLGTAFRNTAFKVFREPLDAGGTVLGMAISTSLNPTRTHIEGFRAYAAQLKLPQPAWGHIEGGRLASSLDKYWTAEESVAAAKALVAEGAGEGDLVLFMAGGGGGGGGRPAMADPYATARSLGRIRAHVAEFYGLPAQGPRFAAAWIVDFPLFERDATSPGGWGLQAVHHPFTRATDEAVVAQFVPGGDPTPLLNLRAHAYDLVLNGQEVGGGSLRIFRTDIQQKVFELLGLSPTDIEEKFGFFLEALGHGAPPHGGIALGLDRLVSLIVGAESIREVIAFPKNQTGLCPLTGAPGTVPMAHIKELGLIDPAKAAALRE